MVLGIINLCVGTIGRIVTMTTVLLCLIKMKESSDIFGFSNRKNYVRLIPWLSTRTILKTVNWSFFQLREEAELNVWIWNRFYFKKSLLHIISSWLVLFMLISALFLLSTTQGKPFVIYMYSFQLKSQRTGYICCIYLLLCTDLNCICILFPRSWWCGC